MDLEPSRHLKTRAPFTIIPLDAAAWPSPQQTREECTMTDCVRTGQLGRALRSAAFVSVAALLSAPVQAGQCPADKMNPGARTSGEMKPKDVTDNVLGQ